MIYSDGVFRQGNDLTVTLGGVTLGCSGGEAEASARRGRLNYVLGFVYGSARASDRSKLLTRLIHAHDHKGRLRVSWMSPGPVQALIYLFEKAWQDCCEHEIEHETVRRADEQRRLPCGCGGLP